MPASSPWLVVGLGNPGARYARHRHNIGAMVVEAWAREHGSAAPAWRTKWESRVTTVDGPYGKVVVLLPQTFMNCSGRAVAPAAAFHGVVPQRAVVVHDELDFAWGRLALKRGGGHGGHNGLRDIIACWGTPDFLRVRVGIGRPEVGEVADWVLSDIRGSEAAELPDRIDHACRAVTAILVDGIEAAMLRFNTPPPT